VNRAIMISLVAISSLAPTLAAAKDVAVSYEDLNLAHPADQARLEARVADAVRAACNDVPAPGSLLPSTASHRCARQATVEARVQVAAAVKVQSASKLALQAR
jgi:UrcA family protein